MEFDNWGRLAGACEFYDASCTCSYVEASDGLAGCGIDDARLDERSMKRALALDVNGVIWMPDEVGFRILKTELKFGANLSEYLPRRRDLLALFPRISRPRPSLRTMLDSITQRLFSAVQDPSDIAETRRSATTHRRMFPSIPWYGNFPGVS